MGVDGLGFPLSLSVGFLPYPQVSLWCCALLSQGERYQQHGRTFRKFDGVARGCLSTHPTRRSFVLRLSGPTILIGHAFTVCIRTENQNQMPCVSVGWPSWLAAVPCTESLQAVLCIAPDLCRLSESGGTRPPADAALACGADYFLSRPCDRPTDHRLVVELHAYACDCT